MIRLLTIPANRKIRIAVELDAFPEEVELPRRKGLAVAMLIFSGVWSFGAPMMMFYYLANNILEVELKAQLGVFSMALIVTLAVLYLGWAALRLYSSRDRMTFHRDRVEVTEFHFFFKTQWVAFYTEFSGLAMDKARISMGDDKTCDYDIIKLVHPDDKKTIPLFMARVPHIEYTRKRRVEYSRKLGIAVLQSETTL